MPKTMDEGNLRFTFDDDWEVVKLDEHAFFCQRLMPLQLTRAVDFLGLHGRSELYLIEAKDFRGSATELRNREKMCDGDNLHLQIARKSKDSVVCVAGAARTLKDAFWSKCADVLRKPQATVKVVFWLEFDLSGQRGRGRNHTWVELEMRTQAANREKQLKTRLNWLTRQVVVTNQTIDAGALPGVSVENIERAGIQ